MFSLSSIIARAADADFLYLFSMTGAGSDGKSVLNLCRKFSDAQ